MAFQELGPGQYLFLNLALKNDMGKVTQCGWELEGGRGAAQQSLIRGGSAPRSNPLPFSVPLFTEKVPLSYTFY